MQGRTRAHAASAMWLVYKAYLFLRRMAVSGLVHGVFDACCVRGALRRVAAAFAALGRLGGLGHADTKRLLLYIVSI